MSLDQLRRRIERVESLRRPQQSEPWGWIIVPEGETEEAARAKAIAGGELRPGQPFIAWMVVSPTPRRPHP